MCLQRIFKRHHEYRGFSRRDIPEGCKDKPNLVRILKVLVFPVRGKRTLKQKLPYYKSMSKEIIWLHSTDEVEAFLAQLESQTNEKNNSSRIPSTPRNRQLALA